MKINKVVGVIPARGGSKGLPNKNILCLGGKPLIAWTIEAALSSKHIDKVIVTTDSPDIASISESYGADIPFVRPANLATDSSKTIDVLKHSILEMGSDYGTIVLLQPTSPFRSFKHIDEAMSLFRKYDRCATLVS
ncbi:MAG: acylneuraminate cytidylyltransferase, partial [Zetaproteobacteria bacterium]|nr:acylneuraminate cytidylyltransferase [Pseudobdellovibrionaceae bacterium]